MPCALWWCSAPAGTGDCLVAGLSRGSVLIDMSSSSPLDTRELGARLAERGVAMLDAAGYRAGVRKAADATLSIMVGGDAAQHRPLPADPRDDGQADFS